MTSKQLTLRPAERIILEALGGSRWTLKRYTRTTVAQARRTYREVHQAVGFTGEGGRWMTDQSSNPKLRKSGLPTIGVTLHAATGTAGAWNALEPDRRDAVAAALQTTVAHIDGVVRATLCPRSTPGCVPVCVAAMSANAQLERSQRARLARSLVTLVRPADALALTAKALDRNGAKHHRRGSRWRVNVADDIRWELLAPGLFHLDVRPYTYTKFSPAERPEALGMRIVYSATERHTDAELVERCRAGHRVCIVFDVAKRDPLPATWHGIPVANGDKTDDLWRHPAGCVVGLRLKGGLDARDDMRRSGFARPAVPQPLSAQPTAPVAVPVTLTPLAA